MLELFECSSWCDFWECVSAPSRDVDDAPHAETRRLDQRRARPTQYQTMRTEEQCFRIMWRKDVNQKVVILKLE
jgi:hypothetical protein